MTATPLPTTSTTGGLRGAAVVLIATLSNVACGGSMTPDDHADIAIGHARDAAAETTEALGLDASVLTGAPAARACLDGFGNETDARAADYATGLPDGAIDEAALDALVAGLGEPPLEDSRRDDDIDPASRLVVFTQQRSGTLVTVRLRLGADGASDLGVSVDCVGDA